MNQLFLQQLDALPFALAIIATCCIGMLAGRVAWRFASRKTNGKTSARSHAAACVLGALCFSCVILRYGLCLQSLLVCAFCCILLALSLTDLAVRIIPNSYLVAGMGIWALSLAISLAFGVSGPSTVFLADLLCGSLGISMLVFAFALVLDKITGGKNLGAGDVKLLFVTGLFLGFAGNMLNLMLSCIIGAIFGLANMALRKTTSSAFPFGPAIAASTLICLLAGPTILSSLLT